MQIILDIFAFLVYVMLVVSVPRAVFAGKPGGGSLALAGAVTVFVLIFGAVSLTVASGIAQDGSSLTQGILLAGFVVVSILCRITWTPSREALPR
jgi:hypothetical protein